MGPNYNTQMFVIVTSYYSVLHAVTLQTSQQYCEVETISTDEEREVLIVE